MQSTLDQPPVSQRLRPVVGAALAAVLAWAVLVLRPAEVTAIALVLVVARLFFRFPTAWLIAFIGLRAVFDLLWWVDVSVFGLNALQVFGGTVSMLALALAAADLERLERVPAFLPAVGFIGVCVFGALRAPALGPVIDDLAKLASPVLLMLVMAAYVDSTNKRVRLLQVVAVMGAFTVLVSLFHLATGQMSELVWHGYHRLQGGFKNLHNHALVMMVVSSLFTWVVAHAPSRAVRAVASGVLLSALVCLYLTYVRTALIGYGVFILTFLVVEKRFRALAVTLAAGGAFALTSDTLADRFGDIAILLVNDPFAVSQYGIGSGRWDIWTISLRAFFERPPDDIALGLGLGQYVPLTMEWVHRFQPNRGPIDPHSDTLALLYQVGPIGLTLYLYLQFRVVEAAVAVRRSAHRPWERGYASFIIALSASVLATNAVSNAFVHRTSLAWTYWVLAGVVLAIGCHRSRNNPTNTASTTVAP